MIYTDIKQGTPEWDEVRLGVVTASKVVDILRGERGYRKGRAEYMTNLAVERITGIPTEYFCSKDMENGKELEPEARADYEFLTGKVYHEVGFATHENIKNFGSSPDGLDNPDIPEEGIEIKCRKLVNHISEIMQIEAGKGIDKSAMIQIQVNLMCTGAKRWKYILYNPSAPEAIKLYVKEIQPDITMMQMIASEVQKFNAELDAYVANLNQLIDKIKER